MVAAGDFRGQCLEKRKSFVASSDLALPGFQQSIGTAKNI
jgi:hypothetical protein